MLKKLTPNLTFKPRCANCDVRAKLESHEGGRYYNYFCSEDCYDEYGIDKRAEDVNQKRLDAKENRKKG